MDSACIRAGTLSPAPTAADRAWITLSSVDMTVTTGSTVSSNTTYVIEAKETTKDHYVVEATQFTGDDPVGPNLNISGHTIEHLDVAHDGFYSVSFDPVPNATGIEFQWTNEGSFRHWTIRELEAYAVPEPSTALLGLLGLTLLARRRR